MENKIKLLSELEDRITKILKDNDYEITNSS